MTQSDWQRLWYPLDAEAAKGPTLPARALLHSGELLFAGAVRARDWLYENRWLKAHYVQGARVVSVGNLNVGGAGKTPTVIALAQRLVGRGASVAVVSRGYGRESREDRVVRPGEWAGASAEEVGDEPLLIARTCPEVSVWVGAQRARLAQRAASEVGAEWILLDDGMQHRKLARDLEVVVIDESSGMGNGRMLPRGPLREPIAALNRADLIWLRSSGGPRAPLPTFPAPVVRVHYGPKEWMTPSGESLSLEALRGADVVAVSGIARPASFLRALEGLGVRVVESHAFDDHHP
ncbi:MAG TPA: tetraacyldisaccharide 4'-kinase, partial [Myxococcaceae bacterium]|nr:tetraacyldisaccharide 4'-kinase [Myxococcaceae bacterium]